MNIFRFDSLPSTNTYLKENFESFKNLDVIIADKQTSGRGRFDRIWDNNCGIALSIIFKNNNYNHAIISSLAVFETLRSLNINAQIKWPNDVYVNNKKISGILIESIFESNDKICDIVGIGLNMNKSEIYDSIGILDFVDVEKDYVIDLLLNNYMKLLNEPIDELRKEYISNNFIIGHAVMYKNSWYVVVGISDDFKIQLKNKQGIIEKACDEIKL